MSVAGDADAVFPDRFGKRIIPKIYDLTTNGHFARLEMWGHGDT